MTTVIDVHTHMLSEEWIALIKEHGAPRYGVHPSKDGPRAIMWDGAPFMTPQEGHLDYELRIKAMNDARVAENARDEDSAVDNWCRVFGEAFRNLSEEEED